MKRLGKMEGGKEEEEGEEGLVTGREAEALKVASRSKKENELCRTAPASSSGNEFPESHGFGVTPALYSATREPNSILNSIFSSLFCPSSLPCT